MCTTDIHLTHHWTSYLLNWTIEPVIYLIEPLNQLFTKLNHWTSYLLNWTIKFNATISHKKEKKNILMSPKKKLFT